MTHLSYIVAAYLITAVVIAAMTVWIIWDRRAQEQALQKADSRRVPTKPSSSVKDAP